MKAILYTFLIAMAPVVELRGAIPAGVASGLPLMTATLVSIVGNLVPVPFVLVFVRKIFRWMEKKSEFLGNIARKFQERAEKKKESVMKYEFWGLVALVAIPLPGTGAWTGALVAAMMDMQLKRAVPAIFVGVLIAGAIVCAATAGVSAMW